MYCIVSCCVALYCIVVYFIVCTVVIVLHCVLLHCIEPRCTIQVSGHGLGRVWVGGVGRVKKGVECGGVPPVGYEGPIEPEAPDFVGMPRAGVEEWAGRGRVRRCT